VTHLESPLRGGDPPVQRGRTLGVTNGRPVRVYLTKTSLSSCAASSHTPKSDFDALGFQKFGPAAMTRGLGFAHADDDPLQSGSRILRVHGGVRPVWLQAPD